MAISNAFVWGNGGAQLTPEQIARQREIEDALLQRGIDSSPVASPLEGLARVANAAAGSFRRGRLIRAERENKAYDDEAFGKLVGILNGGSTVSSSVPMTGAANEVGAVDPAKVDMTDNQVYSDFMDTVKTGVTNPFGLAAIAATGKAESGYSPGNVNRTWSDPSASGQPGTAGGIMSWRGPRLAALQAAGDMSPAGQAKFFLQEDPALITALNNAKSLEEAQRLMNNAWAFRGYDQPGGESARRLSLASGFLPSFQGQVKPTQVASLDPSAGMPKPEAAAAIEATAPGSGYVDPMVTTDYRRPPSASAEAASLPPLPAREVAPAPVVAAVPPVQVAQNAPVVTAPNGAPIPPEVLKVLSDPRISQRTRGIAELLIKQQQARQQAILEQQIKQADPAYQADLRLKNLQADQIVNPKISPADQARIEFDKTKFDTEQKNRGTLTAAEQANVDAQNERLKLDRDKFEREIQQGQWEKMTDGRLYNRNTGEFRDAPPALPGTVPPKFDDISGLRKEIQQLPSYKNLSQALPIYRSMAETAGRNSKASDLNLVYGLGKIMDPTSVVREGEMVMVKNTASLPDWFQGAIASLNGGAALTPETREAIMREAYGRVQGYDSAFKQDTTQYQGIVARNNFNPADVIPDFGTYEPWKPADTSAGPTQIKSVDEYQNLAPGTQYIDPNGKLRTKR
ncbi:hypothetical protein [Rhizobium mesosinicum]|uniref:Phage tail lysozyme domain-containing protein n=1 Tax=Rhizobium mesosinicum TaxID=335017 RepID=A0ABS7GUH6_9HYPH|nr:hypothetical protein [Rhizobium mesosinicum]MBW9053462.1 hypothetical protein [Rhizobium mesosinicum]